MDGISRCIAVYAKVRDLYPTWESLRAFLESDAGGSLRILSEDDSSRNVIIRYKDVGVDIAYGLSTDGEYRSLSKWWVPWFRSVVWDTETNYPVSVAPCKAMPGDPVLGKPQPGMYFTTTGYTAEEFVEGVMVNGYLTRSGANMVWTTRSSIGAKKGFYTTKTFSEMISDAERESGIEDLADIMRNHRFTFASFVLQHPDHRIVQKIIKPRMYLIHLGFVDEAGMVNLAEDPSRWPYQLKLLGVKRYGCVPFGMTPREYMEKMRETNAADWQGLIFKNTTGRWRIRSPSYIALRALRGNESQVEGRFCRLRNEENKTTEYLHTWSEERDAFNELELCWNTLIQNIYTEYCSVHKEKTKLLRDVQHTYRPHIYALHGIYLRRERKTTTKESVSEYLNGLSVQTQTQLLTATYL